MGSAAAVFTDYFQDKLSACTTNFSHILDFSLVIPNSEALEVIEEREKIQQVILVIPLPMMPELKDLKAMIFIP